MTSAPYPNIDAPAWTILLRAESGRQITEQVATELIGPELAAPALAQLRARYLLEDEGQFTPLAERLRLWDRKAQADRAGPPSPLPKPA